MSTIDDSDSRAPLQPHDHPCWPDRRRELGFERPFACSAYAAI